MLAGLPHFSSVSCASSKYNRAVQHLPKINLDKQKYKLRITAIAHSTPVTTGSCRMYKLSVATNV
jgi:hypothetical protein